MVNVTNVLNRVALIYTCRFFCISLLHPLSFFCLEGGGGGAITHSLAYDIRVMWNSLPMVSFGNPLTHLIPPSFTSLRSSLHGAAGGSGRRWRPSGRGRRPNPKHRSYGEACNRSPSRVFDRPRPRVCYSSNLSYSRHNTMR